METLHRQFSKITAGQNRWQRRATRRVVSSSGSSGRLSRPVDRPTPAQPAGRWAPGPARPRRPSGERNLRKPQGSAPAVAENFSRRSGGGVVPTAVASGARIKCGLHVPRRGGLNRTTSPGLERAPPLRIPRALGWRERRAALR